MKTYDPDSEHPSLTVPLPNLDDEAVVFVHNLLYEVIWVFERHYKEQLYNGLGLGNLHKQMAKIERDFMPYKE
jgi:hypothetical protein